MRQKWMAVVALVGFGAGCAQVPSWEKVPHRSTSRASTKPVVTLEDQVHQHPNRPLPPTVTRVGVARASVAPRSVSRPARVAHREERPERMRSDDDGATVVAGTTALGAGIGALVGGKRGATIGAVIGGLGGALLDQNASDLRYRELDLDD